jgi:hypothetical protein
VALLRYSWDLEMARLGTFVGLTAILLCAGVLVLAIYVAAMVMMGISFVQPRPMGPTDLLWPQLAIAVATAVFIAPATAGVYGVVFKILRHEPDPMSGFFPAAVKYFLPAMAVQLVVSLLSIASMILWQTLLGPLWSAFPNMLVAGFVGFLVFLIVPSMVGLDLRLGQAVDYGLKRVFSKPFSYLGYFIAAELMACLGMVGCGIGVILTAGILFVASALLITGIVPTPMAGDPGAYPRYPGQPGY